MKGEDEHWERVQERLENEENGYENDQAEPLHRCENCSAVLMPGPGSARCWRCGQWQKGLLKLINS